MTTFKKINVYYKDAKGITHYIHSTNCYKLVRDAVEGAKILLRKPMYANAESKKIGETIVLSRLFGRKA